MRQVAVVVEIVELPPGQRDDIDIGCVGRQNQNPGGLSRVAVQTRAAQEQAGSRMCKRIHAVRRPDCSTEKKAGQARRPVPACPWSSTFASNASWRAGFSEATG